MRARTAALRVVIVGVLLIGLSGATGSAQPGFAAREHLLRILPLLSGQVMFRLADRLRVATIQGKTLLPQRRWQDLTPILAAPNEAVGNNAVAWENEPSIALNPANPDFVVAFMHYAPADDRCAVFRSTNGGASWSGPIFPALLPIAGDFCSDPVVRYDPTGTYVYALYMSVRSDVSSADIVVSRSSDNGASWSGPVVAMDGVGLDFPDKPWLGVHHFDATQAARVYVTATIFRGSGDCDIVYSGSSDSGVSFPASGAPAVLATSLACDPVVIQGSNVTGGTGGNVLACWYNSETNGWLAGSFDIRCRRSSNNGTTWDAEVTAVNNLMTELPFWMCPSDLYYRVWGAMFPQIRIAPDGTAHLVFTRVPPAVGAGFLQGECGNVVYARSAGLPYSVWTAPATLSTGTGVARSAQNYATLAVEVRAAAPGYALHAFWMDQRLSWTFNRRYDIFRTVSTDGGVTWAANSRVTAASSLTDDSFIGDYIDATATATTTLIRTNVVWTDRRDKTSTADLEDDVYHESVP